MDQVLDKYVQAPGGAQRLAALTSFVARGTCLACGEAEKRPAEVFAKAPGQRTLIIHTLFNSAEVRVFSQAYPSAG